MFINQQLKGENMNVRAKLFPEFMVEHCSLALQNFRITLPERQYETKQNYPTLKILMIALYGYRPIVDRVYLYVDRVFGRPALSIIR